MTTIDVPRRRDVDWRTRAACNGVDPKMFDVAEPGDQAQLAANRTARALCRRCPVLGDCDTWKKTIRPVGTIYATAGQPAGKRRAKRPPLSMCERCAGLFSASGAGRWCGPDCAAAARRGQTPRLPVPAVQ